MLAEEIKDSEEQAGSDLLPLKPTETRKCAANFWTWRRRRMRPNGNRSSMTYMACSRDKPRSVRQRLGLAASLLPQKSKSMRAGHDFEWTPIGSRQNFSCDSFRSVRTS